METKSVTNIDQLTNRFKAEMQKMGATPEGAQWGLAAIDIFHDSNLEVCGMPDQTGGVSAVFDVRQTFQLVKPGNIAGAWDCHITCNPIQASSVAAVFQGAGVTYVPNNAVWTTTVPNNIDGLAVPAAETSMPCSFISASMVPTGQPTFQPLSALGEMDRFDLSPFFNERGRNRVIAAAFEVHNVTAELQKSGSVTMYRCENQTELRNYSISTGGTTFVSSTTTLTSAGPPNTLAEAQQASGITNEAQFGCIIPICIDAMDNSPTLMAGYQNLLYLNNDNTAWAPFGKFASGSTTPYVVQRLPIERSGAYFAGLSDETSLTVSVRVWVEHFPFAGSAFYPLARRPPPMDLRAVQLVAEIQSQMLAGYPVHENAAGDFFKRALSALGNIASKVVRPIKAVAPFLGPKGEKLVQVIEVGENAVKALKGKKKKAPPAAAVKSGGMRVAAI